MIHSTGQPICELRTERMYENFVLDVEYQHLKVLDGQETANYTSHGDVFAIHGSRLTPDRPHPAGWMRSLPRERRAGASLPARRIAGRRRTGSSRTASPPPPSAGAS
jgi:hypothetical protein